MSSNETTLKCKPKRYLWVDNLKMFACLLVVIGHLYMSMMAGGWISENNILYCWPIQTVYTFHVPLFFVCSGFLYQATAPNEWNVKKHIGNIKKKALALGVPYVTFSTITLLLKNVFATDVNNAAPPFLKTLLIEPIAPYWYLYTLFLLFCLIPPVIGKGKRKPLVSMVVIACFMKIIYVGWLADKAIPDLVAKVMASAVWFCIGMLITATPFKKNKLADGISAGIMILACILSYFVYGTPTDNAKVQFIFASIFVLVITYFFQSKEQYKTDRLVNHKTRTVVFMAVIVLLLGTFQIQTYLMNVNAPRYLFFYYGGKTANTYFPLYLLIKLKIWKVISWKPENRSLKKEMVAYSVPMGLGNIGWWINNVSDRYIVTWICGLAANGVYSVAYKIPSLLSMFQQIFNQAWTISAVKEYDQDSSEFYSTIYKAYNMCMVITCAGLILFDKVIAKILFGADFYEAWKYAPFLMISVVFGALVQFLGGIFSAAKESKAFGNTILIGAAANTVMNVAFVYACGPLGAAIATSLSYMLIWVLRLYKVTRQMKLDISLIRDALSYVLLYLQATLLVFYSYNWSGYLIQIGFVVAVFVLYFKELTGVARKVLSRVKSR